MKSDVLVRPNLRAFLLGAILIALVQNFLANGHAPATVLHARTRPSPTLPANIELQELLQQAETNPSCDLYARISRCYERQGEMRKALMYLRRAQFLAEVEEGKD